MNLHEPFPRRTYLGLTLVALGGLVGAAAVERSARSPGSVMPSAIELGDLPVGQEHLPLASTAIAHVDRQPAPSDQVGFVIEVDGATWMVLDIDPDTIHSARAPRLARGDDASDTITRLRDRDLTEQLRGWRGQQVIVDGTCTDTLHDFARITQVTGDPVYAGDTTTPRWTAHSIEANGTHLIVAQLAHCTGSFARAASAPAAVPFAEVAARADLAAEATQRLLASAAGRQARIDLDVGWQGGDYPRVDFETITQITTKVVRDPRNGTTWIAVHAASEFSCGGPDVNLFGLYRIEHDALEVVVEEASPDLAAIDALVDLDGDGVPELLGNGWLTPNRAFYDQHLEPIVAYELPFFGCPC
ncbi:MAG: hypothetical protein ABI467_32575 [Kofleriaceae bacterium]